MKFKYIVFNVVLFGITVCCLQPLVADSPIPTEAEIAEHARPFYRLLRQHKAAYERKSFLWWYEKKALRAIPCALSHLKEISDLIENRPSLHGVPCIAKIRSVYSLQNTKEKHWQSGQLITKKAASVSVDAKIAADNLTEDLFPEDTSSAEKDEVIESAHFFARSAMEVFDLPFASSEHIRFVAQLLLVVAVCALGARLVSKLLRASLPLRLTQFDRPCTKTHHILAQAFNSPDRHGVTSECNGNKNHAIVLRTPVLCSVNQQVRCQSERTLFGNNQQGAVPCVYTLGRGFFTDPGMRFIPGMKHLLRMVLRWRLRRGVAKVRDEVGGSFNLCSLDHVLPEGKLPKAELARYHIVDSGASKDSQPYKVAAYRMSPHAHVVSDLLSLLKTSGNRHLPRIPQRLVQEFLFGSYDASNAVEHFLAAENQRWAARRYNRTIGHPGFLPALANTAAQEFSSPNSAETERKLATFVRGFEQAKEDVETQESADRDRVADAVEYVEHVLQQRLIQRMLAGVRDVNCHEKVPESPVEDFLSWGKKRDSGRVHRVPVVEYCKQVEQALERRLHMLKDYADAAQAAAERARDSGDIEENRFQQRRLESYERQMGMIRKAQQQVAEFLVDYESASASDTSDHDGDHGSPGGSPETVPGSPEAPVDTVTV